MIYVLLLISAGIGFLGYSLAVGGRQMRRSVNAIVVQVTLATFAAIVLCVYIRHGMSDTRNMDNGGVMGILLMGGGAAIVLPLPTGIITGLAYSIKMRRLDDE